MTLPPDETRLTADHTSISGSMGVTGESVWMVNRMLRSAADLAGLIRMARSGPMNMFMCRSPQ